MLIMTQLVNESVAESGRRSATRGIIFPLPCGVSRSAANLHRLWQYPTGGEQQTPRILYSSTHTRNNKYFSRFSIRAVLLLPLRIHSLKSSYDSIKLLAGY